MLRGSDLCRGSLGAEQGFASQNGEKPLPGRVKWAQIAAIQLPSNLDRDPVYDFVALVYFLRAHVRRHRAARIKD